MITIITNALFATSLFITGGNVLSTNFKLHHYSDKDYEELFHLKNKNSIVLHCTKHSELESIKKVRRHRPDSGSTNVYIVTKDDTLNKEGNESE